MRNICAKVRQFSELSFRASVFLRFFISKDYVLADNSSVRPWFLMLMERGGEAGCGRLMSGSFRCLSLCPEIGNAWPLSLEKPPLRNGAKIPEKRWFLLSFVWGGCCNYLINSGAKFCDFLNGVEVGSILRDSRDGRACSVGQRSVFHRPMRRVASGGTTRSVGLCRLLL